MWIDAAKKPERERVYECYREFPDGSHCTEWLRWTGSEWITNDRAGYPRQDVLRYWADIPSPDGWEDFLPSPGGKIMQRQVWYYCNPEKNVECPRRFCRYTMPGGVCVMTIRESCALRSPGGLPLVKCVIVKEKGER